MSLLAWFHSLLHPHKMNPFIPFSGRITAYGYPADSTPDSNSAAGIGAWDNHLVDGYSLAVSRDVEASFRAAGIAPMQTVELYLKTGDEITLCWDDRTAANYDGRPLTGRFDIYCAKHPSALVDTGVVGFRKV